jgi:Zn-finger nucleic acid-binding protein
MPCRARCAARRLGNVIIDTCGTCDVVWLDFGELKQMEDAPGQDRGRLPPAILADAPAPSSDPRVQGATEAVAASVVLTLLGSILGD